MNHEKVKRHLALIRDMAESMEDIRAVELLLSLTNSITPGDKAVFDKVETWLNLIAGNTGGYEHEFKLYVKNRIKKGRDVVRGTYADITITDPNTGVAKAVQLKSTIQDDAGSVTGMIAEAANQLAGERNEQPLPNHRRVIDMLIRSDTNPWPFGVHNGRGSKTELELRQKAIEVVQRALTTYHKHNTLRINANTGAINTNPSPGIGLSPGAIGLLTDVQHFATASMVGHQNVGPNSGIRAFQHGNQSSLLINLAVKIRFSYPYQALPLIQGGPSVWIDEIKMQFDRSGPNLVNAGYAVKYAP